MSPPPKGDGLPPPRVAMGYEKAPVFIVLLGEILHFDDCGEDDFRTDEQVKAFFGR